MLKQRLSGVVDAILIERRGSQEVRVCVEPTEGGAHVHRDALNIVALSGALVPGHRVLLNTVGTELGNSAGDLDFVLTRLDRDEEDDTPASQFNKLRCTPLQLPVLALEAPESPHHDAIRLFAGLDHLP